MSKVPLFLIQANLLNQDDTADLKEAIDASGHMYRLVDIKPFVYDNIPDYDSDFYHIIPYGGTNFIEKCRLTKNWCIWFNENFRYHLYMKHYGTHMFNSDGIHMRMRDFCPSRFSGIETLFIRPDKDLKEFAGLTIDTVNFMSWYNLIKGQDYGVNDDTEIIVATASNINTEWRIFVINGQPISGSQYRISHNLKISADVPERVYEFVREMCKIWVPSDVFVMDVCELNGVLSIVECGDFHSSGWYGTDKRKVIKGIGNFLNDHSAPPKFQDESCVIYLRKELAPLLP